MPLVHVKNLQTAYKLADLEITRRSTQARNHWISAGLAWKTLKWAIFEDSTQMVRFLPKICYICFSVHISATRVTTFGDLVNGNRFQAFGSISAIWGASKW
jgi:hypothetical protein